MCRFVAYLGKPIIIAPASAVMLLDSIAPSHTRPGQFLYAQVGQYWMQINRLNPLELS